MGTWSRMQPTRHQLNGMAASFPHSAAHIAPMMAANTARGSVLAFYGVDALRQQSFAL